MSGNTQPRAVLAPARLARVASRRGSVALMLALMAVPVLAAAGLGVDFARAFLVQTRMTTAIDAAALAGARSIASANVAAEVAGYFWANFGRSSSGSNVGFLGATITGPDIKIRGNDIEVSVVARIPTSGLLRTIGIDSLTARGTHVARRSQAGVELAMVLDTTGSMGASNMAALRSAANQLVDIVIGREDRAQDVWIALVPYVSTVNLGPTRTDWLASGTLDSSRYLNSAWAGCVEARHLHGDDENDATPGQAAFRPFFAESTRNRYAVRGDNDWTPGTITPQSQIVSAGNNGVGPNLGCGRPILPLTDSKAVVKARINELVHVSRGGTMANLGLQAGWFTLSPRWRGLWGDPRLPLDYRTEGMSKVLVIMTDGNNEWHDWSGGAPGNSVDAPSRADASKTNKSHGVEPEDDDADYTGYGRLKENRLGIVMPTSGSMSSRRSTALGRANQEINARMQRLCSAIKANGVTIYTITFNLTNTNTQALYRTCASKPENYFNSPDQAQLVAAFREVGERVARIRLTR